MTRWKQDWQRWRRSYWYKSKRQRPGHVTSMIWPPYWKTEGYGVAFPFEEYLKLAEVMKVMKGRMILTINDHPDMEKVFADFRIERVKINYTVGGADRGKNSSEMIVMNW